MSEKPKTIRQLRVEAAAHRKAAARLDGMADKMEAFNRKMAEEAKDLADSRAILPPRPADVAVPAPVDAPVEYHQLPGRIIREGILKVFGDGLETLRTLWAKVGPLALTTTMGAMGQHLRTLANEKKIEIVARGVYRRIPTPPPQDDGPPFQLHGS